MARPPRVEFPGALYHVLARGNHRQAIFQDDLDRRHYLGRLEHYRARYGLTIYAYVLMTNHVHLLLETDAAPLSKAMQALQGSYARFYNWRHREVGHLFQGRYKAILCDRDAYLLELVRYLHLNPARLRAPIDPWTYPWSSHPAYMGQPSPVTVETSLVLRQFGARAGAARKAYQAFVAEGLASGHQERFYETVDQRFLGAEEFVRGVHSRSGGNDKGGPGVNAPFDLLVRAVAHASGVAPPLLLHRERRPGRIHARGLLVYLGREWGHFGLGDLARQLGRDPSSVSRLYGHYLAHRDPAAEARAEAWLRATHERKPDPSRNPAEMRPLDPGTATTQA